MTLGFQLLLLVQFCAQSLRQWRDGFFFGRSEAPSFSLSQPRSELDEDAILIACCPGSEDSILGHSVLQGCCYSPPAALLRSNLILHVPEKEQQCLPFMLHEVTRSGEKIIYKQKD